MQFNSYSYLALLLPTVAVFWALPVALRRWYVLAVSIAYYASWDPAFTAVPLLLCIGVQPILQKLIAQRAHASRYFWCGIVLVLAIFSFFRYTDLLVTNLNAVLADLSAAPLKTAFHMGAPLGLSFYAFEAISCLIDAKQGRMKNSRFSNLYLFIMFWPHLMAGPILRFRELLPQLDFARRFESVMLLRGLDRLVWGLLQKNLVANTLGTWVDEGFLHNAVRTNTTVDNWTLAAAFGLQIYFDFAAYSNLAIGVSQLIGITLPENFRFPYHAHTPPEFWNRWHMTLSRWIRDYVFFPITARFRGAPLPLYVSLLGVMALVGLWHGTGWGFVVWGVMHGAYLVIYRIWENSLRTRRIPRARLAGFGWRVFTIIAVTAAWVPFRATTCGDAWQMLASMFGRWSFGISYSLNFYLMVFIVAMFCAVEPILALALNRLHSSLERCRAGLALSWYFVRPLLYGSALLVFSMFDDHSTQFIYLQF